ncbi:RimK family alpha-L-glutamate ligase [Methanococcoides sp. SA1]|nr:RimK family alpha-L-glutamate ligase [Methanococcoides sp. SA1]
MKAAVISLGGRSSKAVAEACRKYFEVVDELNLKDFEVCLSDEGINVAYLEKNLDRYDCVYIRGSYKYALLQRSISRALQGEVYMPIRPRAFTLGHDKYMSLLELQKNGVSIPKTHYAATTNIAIRILRDEVDYPVILKVQEGTHGKGVMVAESFKSAKTILDILSEYKRPYVIQEFVETAGTSDIRVIVGGGKVLGAYRRVAALGEFRTNIHMGGKRECHDLTEKQKELAIKSAESLRAYVCGVDILNSTNPSVIEINLSPALAGLDEICRVDLLDEVAKVLCGKTKKFKRKLREKRRLKRKKIEGKI